MPRAGRRKSVCCRIERDVSKHWEDRPGDRVLVAALMLAMTVSLGV